ncbi:unnamed protein product [Linum trigynum]|uniref:J domain-containing protein n=1 Tax=Linum trigynum TaxID=586398 RepID=A0AAV2FF60_9ROSI
MPPRKKTSVKRPRGKRPVKQETHYQILSVKPSATYQEICAAYLSATSNNPTDSAIVADDEKSLRVQRAFQVLSDTQWRAEYDKELRTARRRRNARVIEDVCLLGMVPFVDEERGETIELIHQCDCGDYFSVDSVELQKLGYKLCKDSDHVWFQSPEEPAKEYTSSSPDYDDDDCDLSFGFKCLGSVVVPCEHCSLGIRLSIDTGLKAEYGSW